MWKVEFIARALTVSDSGPPPPPDPPAQCARNMMVFAHYHRFAPASNSDVGLPGRLSHPGPRFFDICSFDCMLDFVLCHHCFNLLTPSQCVYCPARTYQSRRANTMTHQTVHAC